MAFQHLDHRKLETWMPLNQEQTLSLQMPRYLRKLTFSLQLQTQTSSHSLLSHGISFGTAMQLHFTFGIFITREFIGLILWLLWKKMCQGSISIQSLIQDIWVRKTLQVILFLDMPLMDFQYMAQSKTQSLWILVTEEQLMVNIDIMYWWATYVFALFSSEISKIDEPLLFKHILKHVSREKIKWMKQKNTAPSLLSVKITGITFLDATMVI